MEHTTQSPVMRALELRQKELGAQIQLHTVSIGQLRAEQIEIDRAIKILRSVVGEI